MSKPNLSIGKQLKIAEGTDSFALAEHAELFKNHEPGTPAFCVPLTILITWNGKLTDNLLP